MEETEGKEGETRWDKDPPSCREVFISTHPKQDHNKREIRREEDTEE